MIKKLPPFDFVSFLNGVDGMPREEVGDYIRILARLYDAGGGIANDPEPLHNLLECRRADVRKRIRALIDRGKLFVADDGMLHNRRVDLEIKGEFAPVEPNLASSSPQVRPKLATNRKNSPAKTVKQPSGDAQTTAQLPFSPQESFPPDPPSKNPPISPPTAPNGAMGRAPALARESRRPTNLSLRDRQAWDELKTVLSPELVVAVLDHRKAIRQPLTERAAKTLAKNFLDARDVCGLTPDEAADVMIARGWRGFDPEWVLNDRQRRVPPNPAARSPPVGAASASAAPTISDEVDDYIAKLKAKEAGKNG